MEENNIGVELIKAMLNVQNAVKGMEKNSVVGKGNYQYNGTKDADVKEVFNRELTANGLIVVPVGIEETAKTERWEDRTGTKQSVFCKVKTKYKLLHVSGQYITLVGYGHGVDAQDKAAGKATTYAMKNMLLYTFCVPVRAIDDADTTHSRDINTPPVKKATQPINPPKPITDEQLPAVIEWALKHGNSIVDIEKHYELTLTQKALIVKGLKSKD